MQEWRNQPGLFWKTFKLWKTSDSPKENPCRALGGRSAPSLEFPACSCCPEQRGFPTSTLAQSWGSSAFPETGARGAFPRIFQEIFAFHVAPVAGGIYVEWKHLEETPSGFSSTWGWVWGCLAELGVRSFSRRTSPECCVCLFAPDPGIVCLVGVEFHSALWIPQHHKGTAEVAAWSSLPRVIRENQRNSVLLCLALLTKLGASNALHTLNLAESVNSSHII